MDPKQVVHEVKFIYPGRIHWIELNELKRYTLVNNINIPSNAKVDFRYDYTHTVVTVSWDEKPLYEKPKEFDYKNYKNYKVYKKDKY